MIIRWAHRQRGRDAETNKNLWYFFNSDTYFVCDWKSRRHQPMSHKPQQRIVSKCWLIAELHFISKCLSSPRNFVPFISHIHPNATYILYGTPYPAPKRKTIPLNEIYLSISTIPVCIAEDVLWLNSKHTHTFTQQFYSKHIKINANVIKCTIRANQTKVNKKEIMSMQSNTEIPTETIELMMMGIDVVEFGTQCLKMCN